MVLPKRRAFIVMAALSTLSVATPRQAATAVNTPRVHAIVGARIVTSPGHVIPRGTIVIRDGLIEAVGENVQTPADARVWDGDSLTVYAGMIDAYVLAETPLEAGAGPVQGGGRRGAPPVAAEAPKGPVHALDVVRPETKAADMVPFGKETLDGLHAAGFTAAGVAPRAGVVRGQTALVHLNADAANASVLRGSVAQVVVLDAPPRRNTYPSSLMGAIAVARQAISDARWYADAHEAYAKGPRGKERPPENRALAALGPAAKGTQPVLFVCSDMLELLRAGVLAREFAVTAQAVGAGDEYKRVNEVRATGLPLIVPVTFPDPPDVSDPDEAVEVSTMELRHWYHAPENPGILARAGVSFALTADGLKDTKTFREKVRKAIERGLSADQALAAVTVVPARLLGAEAQLGTIEPGKIANLTVTRGDLFAEKGKVREVWVDGERIEADLGDTKPDGKWDLSVRGPGGAPAKGRLIVSTEKDTTVRFAAGGDTLKASGVRLEPGRMSFTLEGARLGGARAFVLDQKGDHLTGWAGMPGGGRVAAFAWRAPDEDKGGKSKAAADTARIVAPQVAGDPEAWRAKTPDQPKALLIHNATVWTCGPQGRIENADLLVRAGKIAAVGKGLSAAGATVIDGTGKHVMPGIIDCHSHSAILGDVNECTNNVTAEVRIRDVINSESENIYRQLAGGTTEMHLLHGSCNSIGGQCQLIKCRWGAPPDALVFKEAPPTIKFALGENPKQSNFGDPSQPRYPQTRAGVEQSIREAFMAARDYRKEWDEFRAGKRKSAVPPRRDFQMETLNEILDGRRFVHSHSYRQDEILMLVRLAHQFGFTVAAFQHVLEGYKVADELAAAGSGASTFSDWWAYKYEVIDAIPYNGYLMWDRGVVVSYNSDDDELARRLNTEAAKAVKYGGVPELEAIKFVTINPAKQLHVESRVGSLEAGKDGDFSIWDGSPLSPVSHCEQTWIEGRKYFDREADLAGRAALAKERDQLIARAKADKKPGGPPGGGERRGPPRYLESQGDEGKGCSTCAQSGAEDAEVQR